MNKVIKQLAITIALGACAMKQYVYLTIFIITLKACMLKHNSSMLHTNTSTDEEKIHLVIKKESQNTETLTSDIDDSDLFFNGNVSTLFEEYQIENIDKEEFLKKIRILSSSDFDFIMKELLDFNNIFNITDKHLIIFYEIIKAKIDQWIEQNKRKEALAKLDLFPIEINQIINDYSSNKAFAKYLFLKEGDNSIGRILRMYDDKYYKYLRPFSPREVSFNFFNLQYKETRMCDDFRIPLPILKNCCCHNFVSLDTFHALQWIISLLLILCVFLHLIDYSNLYIIDVGLILNNFLFFYQKCNKNFLYNKYSKTSSSKFMKVPKESWVLKLLLKLFKNG